jgi:hypothetical protein
LPQLVVAIRAIRHLVCSEASCGVCDYLNHGGGGLFMTGAFEMLGVVGHVVALVERVVRAL